MMVEMVLISNNDQSVTYDIYNYDLDEYVNTMTYNKLDDTYTLANGKEMSNHFESETYRMIKECLTDNYYPERYQTGWGW